MLTCGEALDKYIRKYLRSGRRGYKEAARKVEKTVRPWFGERSAENVTTRDLEAYADQRAKDGVKDSTIRAELACLRRALKLSYQPVPPMPELEHALPRRGYLSIGDFILFRSHLAPWLRDPATFAYMTGWRIASEVFTLKRDMVDLKAGLVTIPTSKNREPRRFPIDLTIPGLGSLRAILERNLFQGYVYVFTHANGKPIRDFRAGVEGARQRSGLKTRPHDWRRSAVTNLHRAGVPTKLAMKLVGHRTVTTHMNYIQEDDSDLRDAVSQLQKFYSSESQAGAEK